MKTFIKFYYNKQEKSISFYIYYYYIKYRFRRILRFFYRLRILLRKTLIRINLKIL